MQILIGVLIVIAYFEADSIQLLCVDKSLCQILMKLVGLFCSIDKVCCLCLTLWRCGTSYSMCLLSAVSL